MEILVLLNKNASGFTERESYKIGNLLRPLSGGVIATKSPEEMRRILGNYSTRQPRILGIGGGDNTIPEVLTAVKEMWGEFPEYIALFPQGAVCNWATSFGLNDGVVDKFKKSVRLGETKALLMARYISECYSEGREFMTEELEPLRVNKRIGFNFGAGGVAKLIWLYEGKTPKQYQRLEERLNHIGVEDYDSFIQEVLHDKGLLLSAVEAASNGNGDLIRRGGSAYPLITVLSSIFAGVSPFGEHRDYYGIPFEGKIFLDSCECDYGDVNAFYVSAYDKLNFGIPLLNVVASPGARKKGKIEAILCQTSVEHLALQLPRFVKGEKVEGLSYHPASKMVLWSERPIVYELDAGLHADKVVTITKEDPLTVISPCKEYTIKDHLRHFFR
ncbi:MAG: diacylglycerol kinase family protein [Candidatus Woesearchaeota archaeon]|jgi:diacylglycerol kinase family enzyme